MDSQIYWDADYIIVMASIPCQIPHAATSSFTYYLDSAKLSIICTCCAMYCEFQCLNRVQWFEHGMIEI